MFRKALLLLILAILGTLGMILLVIQTVYFNKPGSVMFQRDQHYYSVLYYETENGSLQGPILDQSDEIFSSYMYTHKAIALATEHKQLQKPTINHTRRSCSFNGYVLVGKFNEQLESSVYDLYQLSNIASSWDMQIVEPHITGSHLALNPSTTSVFSFSNIYNLTDANAMFQMCLDSCLSPLVPFGQFAESLTHTPVMVVVLYLFRYSISQKTCNSEYYSDAKQLVDTVNRHLTTFNLGKDTTLQRIETFDIVCIDITKANDFQQLLKTHQALRKTREAAMNSHSKLLVLVAKWNGVRTYKDHFFYYDPSWRSKSCPNVHAIKHSHEVIKATDTYFKSLNLTHPLLGVHVRFERVYLKDKSKSGHRFTLECVKKLSAAAKRLVSEHHFNRSSAIAFRDYGLQGSHTCDKKCNKAAKELKIDEALNSLNIRTLNYYFKERTFAASVEQELLSRVDYLLTFGYGSFQSSIIKRFLSKGNRRQQRLISICSEQ